MAEGRPIARPDSDAGDRLQCAKADGGGMTSSDSVCRIKYRLLQLVGGRNGSVGRVEMELPRVALVVRHAREEKPA